MHFKKEHLKLDSNHILYHVQVDTAYSILNLQHLSSLYYDHLVWSKITIKTL